MTFAEHTGSLLQLTGRLDIMAAQAVNPREKARLAILGKIMHQVQTAPQAFDENSPMTRGSIGRVFEAAIGKTGSLTPSDVDELFIFLTRCIREWDLRTSRTEQIALDIVAYYNREEHTLTPEEVRERDYISFELPKHVWLKMGETITEKEREIAETIESWTKKADGLAERLSQSEKLVKQFQQQFNFVGLAKAFKDLADRKRTEKSLSGLLVVLFGTLMIMPIWFQYIGLFDNVFAVQSWSGIRLEKVLPVVILEILLLYHFRIILRNYYSAKAQLLQLELRFALCAFIETYAEFSKGANAGKLDKFEALIFSGIVVEPSKVPSTFDGIEQLATLVAEFRKKSG